jgi:putative endonuclease
MYWVYVLRNREGILYKGFTSNLAKRIEKHMAIDGFNSYTQKRGPWTLVYYEQHATEREARNHERYLKSGQGRQWLKKSLGDYPPKADG